MTLRSSGDTWGITAQQSNQRYTDLIKTKPNTILALNHEVHQQTACVLLASWSIHVSELIHTFVDSTARLSFRSRSRLWRMLDTVSLPWPNALENLRINGRLHPKLAMYASCSLNSSLHCILLTRSTECPGHMDMCRKALNRLQPVTSIRKRNWHGEHLYTRPSELSTLPCTHSSILHNGYPTTRA